MLLIGMMKSQFPFGLSLSKLFDKLRVNGSHTPHWIATGKPQQHSLRTQPQPNKDLP